MGDAQFSNDDANADSAQQATAVSKTDKANPPQSQQLMSRSKQTWLIVGAMGGAMLSYFAYDSITNPNLDGISGYDRCTYWAYYHTHGGDEQACKAKEMTAIEKRVMGHSQSEDEYMRKAEEQLDSEDGNVTAQPMAPTKF